ERGLGERDSRAQALPPTLPSGGGSQGTSSFRAFVIGQLLYLLDFVGNSLRKFGTRWQLSQESLPIVDRLLVITCFNGGAAGDGQRLLVLRIYLQGAIDCVGWLAGQALTIAQCQSLGVVRPHGSVSIVQ